MTEHSKYDINLKMAQLTGLEIEQYVRGSFIIHPIGNDPHKFITDSSTIDLLTTTCEELWNPWENESQCILVRDRLIELGRVMSFMMTMLPSGMWSVIFKIECLMDTGSTPSEAMCAAFTQLELL